MRAAAIGQRVTWTSGTRTFPGEVLDVDTSCSNALVRFDPTDHLPDLELWVAIRNLEEED